MIVSSYFDGDEALSVSWAQHDVYRDALGVIRQGCIDHTSSAAAVLGVEVPEWAQNQANVQQICLPLDAGSCASNYDWLRWLREEVRSWTDAPTLIVLVGSITANQNQPLGYEAEDRLTLALLERFHDVPWSRDVLRVREALGARLPEGAAEPIQLAEGAVPSLLQTGCVCGKHHRRPCE